MSRLILVSHRLPWSVSVEESGHSLKASVGGLATGLAPLMGGENLWMGWSGTSQELSEDRREAIQQDLKKVGCQPIDFDKSQHDSFLSEMCNGVLWPLYHYQVGSLPLNLSGFEAYRAINQQVADAIAKEAKPGDRVWIHDYHFQLVPEMLRIKNLGIQIGFFLHIPFPSFEIFRILPWRREVLKGLLGSDLIGFHTAEYKVHFMEAAKRILELEHDDDAVIMVDHKARVGVYPLGVDAEELGREYSGDTTLADAVHTARRDHPELKFLLSVDRLDYTKGLGRKLLAYEKLLEDNPDLQGKLMLIQIAPPSREDVPAYHDFRRQLDEQVGRINGRFSTPAYQPIYYLTRSFHPQEIYQVYKDVDVMLVTPVRDGMNLVAKEFIAARDDNDGVLVLSEFAGASSELFEALMINPYDLQQIATRLKTAVEMPAAERKSRMRALRDRVLGFRTSDWAEGFLTELREAEKANAGTRPTFADPEVLAAEILSGQENKPLNVVLDYDGTLFPIVSVPAMAIPDEELRRILDDLMGHENVDLHIVSGRPMRELQSWFAGFRLHLHAEHGAISNLQGVRITADEKESLDRLQRIMHDVARDLPGAWVEQKTFSACFHYRNAEPHEAEKACAELRTIIERDFPELSVLDGKKALEARFPHLHKGIVINEILDKNAQVCLIAVGDDRTDEDMFRTLAGRGHSIVVGAQASSAGHRLRDSDAVRSFLKSLHQGLKQQNTDAPSAARESLYKPTKWRTSSQASG